MAASENRSVATSKAPRRRRRHLQRRPGPSRLLRLAAGGAVLVCGLGSAGVGIWQALSGGQGLLIFSLAGLFCSGLGIAMLRAALGGKRDSAAAADAGPRGSRPPGDPAPRFPVGARPQHYQFAHRALPSVLFQGDSPGIGWLFEPVADAFLAKLWQRVGEHVGQSLAGTGLHCTPMHMGARDIAYIRMPHAVATTEAEVIVVVSMRSAGARYFTVERGMDLGTGVPMMLCEWSAGGHILHRESSLEPETLLETIRQLVEHEAEPSAAS